MISLTRRLGYRASFLLAAILSAGSLGTEFALADSVCPSIVGAVTGIQIGSADVGTAPSDQVTLIRGGASQPVRKGMPLCAGDHIAVQREATLVMSLAENVESSADITLSAFATVELTDPHSILLRIGRMFATLRGLFEARTTFARLGAKGTELQVEVTDTGIEVIQLEGDLDFQPLESSKVGAMSNPPTGGLFSPGGRSTLFLQEKQLPKEPTGPGAKLGRLSRLLFVPGHDAQPQIVQVDETLVRKVVDANANAILGARPAESSRSLIPNFSSNERRARAYREARFGTIWLPEDPRYFQLLGNVYVDWAQAQKAARAYQNAGKIQGGNRELALYYNNLGNTYRLAGSPKEAEGYFVRARDADPTLAFPYNGWGDLFHDLAQAEYDRGNVAQAREFLERAAKLYLRSLDPLLQGKEGGRNRAIPTYHLGELALLRARLNTESAAYQIKPDLDEAQHRFEEALNLAPEYAFARVGLGRVWAARARAVSTSENPEESARYLEAARTEYRHVIADVPSFAPAQLAMGESYDQQDDWKAAAQYFLQATQADPEYPLAYYKTAVAFKRLGDTSVARNYFAVFLKVESPLLRGGNRAKEAQDAISSPLSPPPPLEGTVPSLTGVSVNEAVDRLNHAGLQKGRVRNEHSDAPRDSVVRQQPVAGTKVSLGARVDLWRSSGPNPPVDVPSVVDMKPWQAQLALAVLGLGMREQQVESGVEKGKIVRQDPPAGARAMRGTEIVVDVSSGGSGIDTGLVAVPRVVGHFADRAKAEIENAGLVFDLRLGDSPERSNIVQRQEPLPGTKVSRGAKVTVYVD